MASVGSWYADGLGWVLVQGTMKRAYLQAHFNVGDVELAKHFLNPSGKLSIDWQGMDTLWILKLSQHLRLRTQCASQTGLFDIAKQHCSTSTSDNTYHSIKTSCTVEDGLFKNAGSSTAEASSLGRVLGHTHQHVNRGEQVRTTSKQRYDRDHVCNGVGLVVITTGERISGHKTINVRQVSSRPTQKDVK